MKTNLKAVLFIAVAALSGIGMGAMDKLNQDRKADALLTETCKSQPLLAECVERKLAARSIRYFFNGKEYRDGNPVNVLGANN